MGGPQVYEPREAALRAPLSRDGFAGHWTKDQPSCFTSRDRLNPAKCRLRGVGPLAPDDPGESDRPS